MSPESTEARKRKYEQRKRADSQAQTRRRITEAAVELHGSVGPARTSIAAIAERAGVRRATVYRHFPDERSLFLACSGHYAALNPLPDPESWVNIADPGRRLRVALDQLYGYYERTEAMQANIARDREIMPILREIGSRRVDYIRGVEDGLARGRRARGRRAQMLRATLALALDFATWRTLVRGRGLDRAAAIDLMADLVEAASAPRGRGAA